MKYDVVGNCRWIVTLDGPTRGCDRPRGLAIDRRGSSYVGGFITSDTFNRDLAIAKYDSSGTLCWTATWDGTLHATDEVVDLKVDDAGNCYVTGKHLTSPDEYGHYNYLTIKYDTSGRQVWLQEYDAGNMDEPAAIALDRRGNVVVTGRSRGPASSYDYLTIKYDSSGVQEWVVRYDGHGQDDEASGMAIDTAGRIYVTGSSVGEAGDRDVVTLCYAPNRTLLWLCRYSSPRRNDDQATAIGLDDSMNVYVSGTCYDSATKYDFITIRYSKKTQGMAESEPGPLGLGAALDATVVRGYWRLQTAAGTNQLLPARVLDVAGRVVRIARLGVRDTRHLAPGIYFLIGEGQALPHKLRSVRKVVL